MTIGVICEYNPFHNGHIYQIQKIKEKYPDAILIICLNGLFTERGEMSVLSPKDKTTLALSYGVDLIISLPTLYGTQSADTFAEASITLLNALNVQKLIFGSETNDISYLENLARKQLENDFKIAKDKTAYPARLNTSLEEKNQILPNDLLGISYIKAILKQNVTIEYECMERTVDYFAEKPKDHFASASYIREHWQEKDLQNFLPKEVYPLYQQVSMEKLFPYLKFQILTDPHLEEYLDVTEGLDFKCRKEILLANSYEDFLQRLKSKRYTYNRLRRMLIHIFLGIKKMDAKTPITYINILGINEKGKNYIRQNKKKILLPITTDKTSKIYLYERNATLLYDLINKTNTQEFFFKNTPYISTIDKESSQK